MSENCIFCKIAQGQIPCAKVYETENLLAFLDMNPAAHGHTLLIPKQHAATLLDLNPDTGSDIVVAIQAIAKAQQKALGAAGFNCLQNNFAAVGQEVMHLHFHIVPRFSNDLLAFSWNTSNYSSQDEMNSLAELLKQSI